MDDRRRGRGPRLPHPLPCWVASDPETSFGGLLVSLSEAELEVVLDTALRPATLVCVDLPEGRIFMACVVQVGREPDGAWLHACELLGPPPGGAAVGSAPAG